MSAMTLRDDAFDQIASLMYDTIGIAFTEAKRHLVSARLGPRIQTLGLSGYDEYVTLISTSTAKEELQVAIDLLTTNETYFFREPAHFELLERELKSRRPRELAIWSAASSYGDEAFSLAMLCDDLHRQGMIGPAWLILGTDISDRVLRSASAAIYPEERLRTVSADQLRRHCLRGSGDSAGYIQIAPALRSRVKFGRLNLSLPIHDVGPFDVIFLRNVLIYFDTPTKHAVIERVLGCLRPGGLFFVGTAEGRVPGDFNLKPIAPGVHRKPS